MTTTVKTLTTEDIQTMKALLEKLDAEPEPTVDPKFQVTGEFIELPKVVADALLAQYHTADDAYKAAKKELDKAKQQIIDAMGHAEVLVIEETDQQVVTHRVTTSMILDTAKLKQDLPEVAAKYQKVRTSRPFNVLV